MARKKRGGHGGHGWFVTFADLMALLMAFFVMVAAYSSQDKQKLQIVAGSMRDAFGTQKDVRLAGIVEVDGIPTKTHIKNSYVRPIEDASDNTAPNHNQQKEDGLISATHDRGFALAAASLRQALREMPEIGELSRNILVEVSETGIDIQLVDQDGRAMFDEGSTQPNARMRKLLAAIAPTLRRMPNKIAITGHTATPRPGTFLRGNPWALSVGRASAVREILGTAGVPDERFASVAGKADTEPLIKDNPYLPFNRRVAIVLKADAPPLPNGAKP
ncbi:MAG: flagellar motor protein MotB [Bosea sp.]|uniref:OmpA/MotB family protein n=1 Tax=Bosea sp. (in: a-proteobacteria) TaxID=1871050 RepID=UPI001AC4EF0D|nr:flagellar motor protein MotB [Bosea sp. (in: a-proteobacteria)]MBN9471490.1 flagellar motor protein MotB [Bosea sp. (in: a-proteobacteria)]